MLLPSQVTPEETGLIAELPNNGSNGKTIGQQLAEKDGHEVRLSRRPAQGL